MKILRATCGPQAVDSPSFNQTKYCKFSQVIYQLHFETQQSLTFTSTRFTYSILIFRHKLLNKFILLTNYGYIRTNSTVQISWDVHQQVRRMFKAVGSRRMEGASNRGDWGLWGRPVDSCRRPYDDDDDEAIVGSGEQLQSKSYHKKNLTTYNRYKLSIKAGYISELDRKTFNLSKKKNC